MKTKSFLISIICLFLNQALNAQEAIGNHPRDQDWKALNSPATKVIYPEGLEFKANRIANFINYMKENKTRSVGDKAFKLTVILHNRTVESNGFVGLFPFRSEFFSIPPQNFSFLGSIDFLTLLSIHEYRHALQYSNARRGITKIAYWLGGEQGWGIAQNLAIPNWYFEGDAVVQETALTNAGRGRTANFTVFQRTIAEEGITYNYAKIRNGSIKDLVPDHYRWGYMMLSHLRNEFGNDISKDILHDAAAYKKVFYPYSRSMKKHIGLKTKELYRDSWESSKDLWNKRTANREFTEAKALSAERLKTITTYHFPQYDEKGDLIVWKRSNKKTDHIVRIVDGKEEEIVSPGFTFDLYFDIDSNKIIWTETRLNPRRNAESFNDIYLYDRESKCKSKLTEKGRYFSPSLSPDGKFIYAVHIDKSLKPRIVRLDLSGENEEIVVEFKSSEFIARPSYSEELNALVYILQSNNSLSLWKYDLKTKEKVQLSPYTQHIIDAPFIHKNQVYFSSDFDQIDNIYRVPLDGSMKLERMSSSKFGAYEPSLDSDGKHLIYKEAIFNGNRVSRLALDSSLKEEHQIVEPLDQRWMDSVAAEAEGGNMLNDIPTEQFESRNYKGFFRGLKLHSWPITASNSSPSLSLNFINYLSEFSAVIEGGYNQNEDAAFLNTKLSYAKYFPVFSLLANQSTRKTDFLDPVKDVMTEQTFNQNYIGGEVSVPLNWYSGNFKGNFEPQISLIRYLISNRSVDNFALKDRNYNLVNTGFNFSFTRRIASKQVAPRKGIDARFNYNRNAAFPKDEKIFATGKLYLPALFRTHSLQLSGAYQKELLSNEFQLADDFEYSRGFETPINDEFKRLSVDYGFPLIYPDKGIWGITYFKRIRGNVFFDYGEGLFERGNKTNYYSSLGGELIFDSTFWNLVPLSFGLRVSFLQTEDPEEPKNKVVPGFFIASSF